MMRKLHRTAAFAALVLGLPAMAGAATFTVVSNGNGSDASVGNGVCKTSGTSGVCTLRAAIQEANATAGIDTILFNIGGGGPQRIDVSSALPTITRPVILDATSQPGYTGAPLIELHGSSVGDGLKVSGGGSTIKGFVINHFSGDGIYISSLGGNVVEANYIGLSADGSAGDGNGQTGIRIESPNNRVGGRDPSQRNVVSGNTGRDVQGGIMISGANATGNIVQGNYIGLDATGLLPIGNEGRGVAIHSASGNYVGGSQPGAGNLIAGNRATGVRIWGGSSTGNVIQGNYIGCNKLGEISVGLYPEPGTLSNARGVQSRGDGNYIIGNYILGNTWDGVLFYDGTDKDFDPTAKSSHNVVYKNVIAWNGMNGIGAYVGRANWFIANAIFENDREAIELGELELDGVSPNDLGDGDNGPNDMQNYPELLTARVSGSTTTITGTLNSRATKTYQIEFFANDVCDPSGHGEAKYYLGDIQVVTNASGNASFSAPFGFAVPRGMAIAAIAMDPEHNTSEVSQCVIVQ